VSVQAITWVIENSRHKGSEFVVLLMIANHAHGDGTGSWPSIETLAREARITPRHVIRILPKLQKSGELIIDREAAPHGTNLYALRKMQHSSMDKLSGDERARTPDKRGTANVTRTVLNRSEPSGGKTSAASPPGHRHRLFVEFALETFKAKHGGHVPTWNGHDYRKLADLLNHHPQLQVEELRRRWTNFLASSQQYVRDQGDSLRFFCSNFDRFIDGPLFAATVGGTNATRTATGGRKPTVGDAHRTTIDAYNATEQEPVN
jgi:helix-turn-helix protein